MLLHLRELREAKNLSQTDVAKYLKISRQSYNFYENGKRFPNDAELLKKLAKFYSVTVDYLIGYNQLSITTSLSQKEKQLLKNFRELNKEGQIFVLGAVKNLAEEYQSKKKGKNICG